jgi:hypothetical protein
MSASDCVKVLIDGLTDGGKIYAKGQVVFEPSDVLLDIADSKRVDRDGNLIAVRLSKSDALRAAKREDAGEAAETVVDASSTPPVESPEEDEGEDEEGEEEEEDDLSEMTVADLKDIAEEEDVDLDGITRKADIVEAIKASRASR